MNVQKIAEAWARINQTDRLYVAGKDGRVYVESPDDQGLTDKDKQEGLLRVFTTVEDGAAYKGIMEIVAGPLELWWFDTKLFYSKLAGWHASSMKQMQCPLRAALCALDEDGWAVVIDELWKLDRVLH